MKKHIMSVRMYEVNKTLCGEVNNCWCVYKSIDGRMFCRGCGSVINEAKVYDVLPTIHGMVRVREKE